MHCLWCNQGMLAEVDWNTLFMPVAEQKLCANCEPELDRLNGHQCKRCSSMT